MRIAIVSTIYKRTPPNGYGGIERIVYTLTEQLIKDGHEVTLFATPGSYCSGKTIEVKGYDPSKAPSCIIKKTDKISEEPLYLAMKEYLMNHPVDIIHDWSFDNLFVLRHPERFPFVITTCIPNPPGYKRPNLVTVSRIHAKILGGKTKNVHTGIDLDNWPYSYKKNEHFVHIAKIAKYKAQHLAIFAARKSDKKLIIAGNIENQRYFNFIIKPLLWISPKIKYIGEIKRASDYLCNATALIQTPKWFDTFPYVILESLASATPVISFAEGGVPEQIEHGVNGFLCKTLDDLIEAMERIHEIKPENCRAYAEEHFSVKRMARDYYEIYQSVIEGETW